MGFLHCRQILFPLSHHGTPIVETTIDSERTLKAPAPGLILDWEDLLEKGMATHSSILAWRISWTEKSGELLSLESQRVRYD